MAEDNGCPYDLFVSFAEEDRGWVKGYLLRELDLDEKRILTKDAFRPGAPLLAEIEHAVVASRYTLLVLSPAYLADEWGAFGENLVSFLSVRDRKERLIPLQLKACSLPLRIDFRVRLDCVEEANWADQVARLRDLFSTQPPLPVSVACPYPGMAPFSPRDARFFYGREGEIETILQHLRHHRFLAVIGPSGSGKSSLVAAGVLPKLDRCSYFSTDWWKVRQIRPGSQPWQSLTEALAGEPDRPREIVAAFLAADPPAQRLLLVIDQFEELFTQCERSQQARFIGVLQDLRQLENCALVIAMRADFYPELMQSDLWPIDPSQRIEIAPLRGGALRDAIKRPAQDVGVFLETSLVDALLADAANEPGILPMLQETLVLLWGQLQRRYLPGRAYRDLCSEGKCGLAVAMQAKADATWVALSDPQQRIARRIFLRLIQLGQGRADTRRQRRVADLLAADDDPQVFEHTLCQLVDNRLLTLSGEEAELHSRKVDIAHEALISGWPMLADWIQESRRALETWDRLEARAANWLAHNRQAGLLDDIELRGAEKWLESQDADEIGHSQDLEDMVAASRAAMEAREQARREAQEHELQLERARADAERRKAEVEQQAARKLRSRATALAFVAAMAIVAAVVALLFYVQGQSALAKAQQNESLYFQKRADEQLAEDPVASLDLSAQALPGLNGRRPFVPEAEFALTQALRRIQEIKYLAASGSLGRPAQFAPNEEWIAVGGDTLHLVARDLSKVIPLAMAAAPILSVAWSDDGSLLLSLGEHFVQVWQDREVVGTLGAGGDDIASESSDLSPRTDVACAAWRPRSHQVAVCYGNALILWTPGSDHGQLIATFPQPLLDVRWSEDGQRLAAWDVDSSLLIWDNQARDNHPFEHPHPAVIQDAAWSSDGRTLVTAAPGITATLAIWSMDSPAVPVVQDLPMPHVAGVEFVDKERFLVWDVGGSLALWSVNGDKLRTYSVEGQFSDARLSADRKSLLSMNSTGLVQLWDIDSDADAVNFRGHTRRVVSYNWTGPYLVTGSEDGTTRVWRLEDGKLLTVLHGHRAGPMPPRADVLGSVWVDDQRLTTAGTDGSLRLWHVFDDEGKPVCQAEDGLAACEEHSRRLAGGEEGFGWIDSARWIDVATIVYTGVASDGTLFAGRESQDPNLRWLWRDDSDHPADLVWSPSGRYLLLRKMADFSALGEEVFDSAIVLDGVTMARVKQLVGPLAWADWIDTGQDADLLLVSRVSGDELVDVNEERAWALPEPSGHQAVISAAQPHGNRLAVGRADGTVYVWDYTTDSIENVFVADPTTSASRIVDLRWDATGKQLLMICCSHVALWDSTISDEPPQKLPLSNGGNMPAHAEFSPDDRWIAVSAGEQLLVFDASTGNEVVRNRAHQDTIQGIQWMRAAGWPDQTTASPLPLWKPGTSESDRLLLLSWSGDGTARLWHLDTRSDPERLIEIWQVNDVDQVGHRSFRAGAISPDQSQILTVNNDGVVRIWKTWVNDPKELIRLVKELRDQANQEGRLP